MRLADVEKTPMCLASTSNEKVSPSASQVGSDDIEGSAVGTAGTAFLPLGFSERNAYARASLSCPWKTTRLPSGDKSGQPSAYAAGTSGDGTLLRVTMSMSSARFGVPHTKRIVRWSGRRRIQ